MAQWLRALVALPKDPGSVPSFSGSQLSAIPVPKALTSSSGPCAHCMHAMYTHTHADRHHTSKNKGKKNRGSATWGVQE